MKKSEMAGHFVKSFSLMKNSDVFLLICLRYGYDDCGGKALPKKLYKEATAVKQVILNIMKACATGEF